MTSHRSLADALDVGRYAAIVDLAERAASYCHSVALAAERGERLTVETHCRQVSLVTKEAFHTVKKLGAGADGKEGAS